MVSKAEQSGAEKKGIAERGSRFFRDIHVVGAAALAGAGILMPPLAPVLETAAAFEAVHAGAWEVARRHFAKKGKK